MNEFTIKAKLPSLNDFIKANRANAYKGNKFKQDVEMLICCYIRNALTAGTLRKPTGAVIIEFEWHEKTKRRDADNIASAKKFILDALQKQSVLKNDSRKYVIGFNDIIIDDNKDFVVVRLLEDQKQKRGD